MRNGAATTRLAKPKDFTYVKDLAKRFTDAVGFLPAEAVRTRIDRAQVRIALENGDPCGYVLEGTQLQHAKHIRPIFQAAVQMDAQRRHHGLKLIEEICSTAAASHQTIVQCYCRQTLDANSFWKAAGFVAVALRHVNATRGAPCILWRRPLHIMTASTLLEIPANPRNHAAGGRSVHRYAWDKLPLIETYSTADIEQELRRLNRAA